MADSAARQTWERSPLHGLLDRYESAETTVNEQAEKIEEYEKLLRQPQLSNDLSKSYIGSIARAEKKLKEAQDLQSFYNVMSPISEILNEMFVQIRDNPGAFAESVKVFEPEGTFKTLLRTTGPEVPRNLSSTTPTPDFLTYNLLGRFNKNQLFEDIVDGNHASLVGFYGTSGAGKTRSIFEIFAKSYGLYFVAADAPKLNPGSSDVSVIYNELDRVVKEHTQDENGNLAGAYTNVLVLFRLLVFCALQDALNHNEQDLTPELWLRAQLAPRHYFGNDIFNLLVQKFISESSSGGLRITKLSEKMDDLDPHLRLVWKEIKKLMKSVKFNVAFDEAQVLANKFMGCFASSEDRDQERSLLSPISKTLVTIQEYQLTHHPIFSGTGFSITHIETQLSSATGKGTNYKPLHYTFTSLDKNGVKNYLECILDLSGLDDDILEYTCKWLTGRPRWTVAFMDILLLRSCGDLTDLNTMFLQQIRRFVAIMTQLNAFGSDSKSERESRLSWRYGGSSSARNAVERIQDKANAEKLKKVKEALLTHLFTDQVCTLSGDFTPELVNIGLCQVEEVITTQGRDSQNGVEVQVMFSEPLILEAALQYFLYDNSLLVFVRDVILSERPVPNRSSAVYMEYYTMLCAFKNMKNTLNDAMSVVTGDNAEDSRARHFKDLEMPHTSSCGKLVRDYSHKIDGTLDWMYCMDKYSKQGRVDFVEPFCYPVQSFGADVMTMMRRTSVQDLTSDDAFVPVLIQVKHPTAGEEGVKLDNMNLKAVMGVFPELVFRSKQLSKADVEKDRQFLWSGFKRTAFPTIIDECKRFFRVDELNLGQQKIEGNARQASNTDLDWKSRRRPVIMMVCQTGNGQVVTEPILRHSSGGSDDPRNIALAGASGFGQQLGNLNCVEQQCHEDIHDFFLVIDEYNTDLAINFFGDNVFIERAREATRTNRHMSDRQRWNMGLSPLGKGKKMSKKKKEASR